MSNQVITAYQYTDHPDNANWKTYFSCDNEHDLELAKRGVKDNAGERGKVWRIARIEILTDEKGNYTPPNAEALQSTLDKVNEALLAITRYINDPQHPSINAGEMNEGERLSGIMSSALYALDLIAEAR